MPCTACDDGRLTREELPELFLERQGPVGFRRLVKHTHTHRQPLNPNNQKSEVWSGRVECLPDGASICVRDIQSILERAGCMDLGSTARVEV